MTTPLTLTRRRLTGAVSSFVLMLMLPVVLSGCTPVGIEALEDGTGIEISDERKAEMRENADELYEKARDGADAALEAGGELAGRAEDAVAAAWLKTCRVMRGWAAFVVVTSMLLGLALIELFPANAEIRKFGLVSLCIRVPVIMVVLTYVTAFAYGYVAGGRTRGLETAALPGRICVAWYAASSRVSTAAFIGCIVSLAVGLFLSEKYRDNPDLSRSARKYLCARIPLAAFLGFVVYPFAYLLFS